MPCVEHNEIIKAFARQGAHPTNCDRADPDRGYTHVHGPNTKPQPQRCNDHLVDVEKTNGTVSLFEPVALALGAMARQPIPIAKHVMGHSAGASFGDFGFGFDASAIVLRWGSFDAFAKAVVLLAQHPNIKRW